MKKLPTDEAPAAQHPAEAEVARLRAELGDERIKTDALSRHCIRLGEALDAAGLAEEARTEADIFAAVNHNSDRRTADAIAKRRKAIRKRKAEIAYELACSRNLFFMGVNILVALTAFILNIAGIITPGWWAAISAICLIAFGWSLNTCLRLLRRMEA